MAGGTPGNMSDPDPNLARRARQGDAEALLALYERHHRPLFGFLTRMARDRFLAEDLFQEVWMKVTEKIEQFDPEKGSFRGWIFRIAANGMRDSARRAAVRRGPDLDAPLGDGSETMVDQMPAPGPDPERGGTSLEARRALETALAGLPPSHPRNVYDTACNTIGRQTIYQSISYQRMAPACCKRPISSHVKPSSSIRISSVCCPCSGASRKIPAGVSL